MAFVFFFHVASVEVFKVEWYHRFRGESDLDEVSGYFPDGVSVTTPSN